ncbi:hypothetical protein VTP01DRAFT_10689, partial [Rhizomucor pusillus]|uniref:uncharacterized protein n=1 Tax=Rhizomucor pusillus TaxID=4840 RepID=UPI0037427421
MDHRRKMRSYDYSWCEQGTAESRIDVSTPKPPYGTFNTGVGLQLGPQLPPSFLENLSVAPPKQCILDEQPLRSIARLKSLRNL